MVILRGLIFAMGIWSSLAFGEDVSTIIQVPIAGEIERYGYFLGNKITIEKGTQQEGIIQVSLPPELVGDSFAPLAFKYKISGNQIILESELGSGICNGTLARANCNLQWKSDLGDIEKAKAYIDTKYKEKYPEAIEPLKQVTDEFHSSLRIYLRF